MLGAQIGTLRAYQGRFDAAAVQRFVETWSHMPTWRAALAYTYCELDRFEEAREHFAVLASQGFNLEQNRSWHSASEMAQYAAACESLRDRDAAAVLYRYLEPFAGQVAMVSNVVLSYGSFALSCARLAAVLERWDEAERHFTAALAMNERLGARPYLVQTRRSWASMLLDRDAPGDRERARELIAAGRAEAEELGMARELVHFDRLQERS